VDRAREAVVQALATGGEIPGQARNLVELAWPAGKRDEVVAARARLELAHFGSYAIDALRVAINTVPVSYTEEVVVTTLAAQKESRVQMSREYLPIIIDALWVGSHGAKVLAIRTLAKDRNGIAVAPMIDSAIADPSLAPMVLEALGAMRYEQARFYLESVMMEGPPELRPVAASALAQTRGAALTPLKKALKSESRQARLLAVRALLPVATEYEVGALYEYIEKHGDDDPELTKAIKLSAVAIEKAIAARDAKAAADNPKDF
jgi:HEAT repeat protein